MSLLCVQFLEAEFAVYAASSLRPFFLITFWLKF